MIVSSAKALEQLEQTVTAIPPSHSPSAMPGARQHAAGPSGRVPWRTAGIGLTSLGTPIGIGLADPLFGGVTLVIELAITLTIISTALFGSQALSERAFRLLRWIANRPEPPGPAPGLSTSRPALPSADVALPPVPLDKPSRWAARAA